MCHVIFYIIFVKCAKDGSKMTIYLLTYVVFFIFCESVKDGTDIVFVLF